MLGFQRKDYCLPRSLMELTMLSFIKFILACVVITLLLPFAPIEFIVLPLIGCGYVVHFVFTGFEAISRNRK